MYILGIESSCDETSLAIIKDGREIIEHYISSQIKDHAIYGGVVPEIASRKHLEAINPMLEGLFQKTGLSIDDCGLIAVTRGPGLVGALLVGVSCAKTLSFMKNIPIVGVNHMQGHISANYLAHRDLEPPFLSLVVSGGHSYLCDVKDYGHFEVLGRTLDDAAGESFDKVSRLLDLGYPGGPKIQKLAEQGDPKAISFPRAKMEDDDFDFSFSGLKTAVLNYVHNKKQSNQPFSKADVAASFQEAVIDVLVHKSKRLMDEKNYSKFCLSGGVAANLPLRQALEKACSERGIQLYFPPIELCTDNAAMIACAGYYQWLKEGADDLSFSCQPNLSL